MRDRKVSGLAAGFQRIASRALRFNRGRRSGRQPRSLAGRLECLEARLALAGDSAASGLAQLQPAAAVYFSDSLIGPTPIVFTESQIVGNEIPSFVIQAVANGVVEKWDASTETWLTLSTTPTTSNPTVLLNMLNTLWVQPGDRLRWIPGSVTGSPTERAFEIIGWDDGVAPPPIEPTAPTAVQDLAITATGEGELTLSWNKPASGDPTRYTVTSYGINESSVVITPDTSLVFAGLSPSVAHVFSVTASNATGTGPMELAEKSANENVASQPTGLLATPGPDAGQMTLSWQPPEDDGGSSVIFYTATIYQGGQQQTITTSSTSHTFTEQRADGGPLLFRVRAVTFAGKGLPASLAVAADGVPLPLPPSNPYMGLEGTSTMHANAASSDATVFSGPGASNLEFVKNFDLNATMPSILMAENGALVCVGVGTSIANAQTPIVMLLSPKTLEVLDQVKLVKPQSGNLAGGLYNYLDQNGRLVLVNADGYLQWYSNNYDAATDTGTLTLEQQVDIGQPMVVGLVPDYEGRIWFATQGSLSTLEPPAVMGFYDPSNGQTKTFSLPAGEMVANSISSSPAGVAVATTTAVSLFKADEQGEIQQVWRQVYENSGDRKPGQLSPGTGSTPVFFGPSTGYEYLVITDNATAPGTDNKTPAEHVNIYDVSTGSLVAQADFLTPTNSGTENAPIAVGDQVFVPSTYGYWYPPPSETPSNSVPTLQDAPFVGGVQGMTLASGGTVLQTNWGATNTVPSSALPRLSLADNLIYTIIVDSEKSDATNQTTASYSFAAIDAATGDIVGVPLPLGSNTFHGDYPSYLNTSQYTWNTLQMTGVISPSGVFYQGTAAGVFMVRQRQAT